MPQSWFIWKGKNSREMGLWVSHLPPEARAAERVKNIKVPGRSGSLTLLEGDNVYESQLLECTVTARRGISYGQVLDWLSGSGDLILSSSPNRARTARISGEVLFDAVSNDLCQAEIPFFCEPLKKQFPQEADIQDPGGAPYVIFNPGTVPSKPLVRFGLIGGSQTLQIGTRSMSFSAAAFQTTKEYNIGDHVSYGGALYRFNTTHAVGIWNANHVNEVTALTVDCEAQIIYSNYGIYTGGYTGQFWEIPVGNCTVFASSNVRPTITPRWRWR